MSSAVIPRSTGTSKSSFHKPLIEHTRLSLQVNFNLFSLGHEVYKGAFHQVFWVLLLFFFSLSVLCLFLKGGNSESADLFLKAKLGLSLIRRVNSF